MLDTVDKNGSNKHRILNAAIRCFEQYGVRKTTMEDVARTAGLARKTVYRTFADRNDLIDTVAHEQIRKLTSPLNYQISEKDDFATALTTVIVTAAAWFRRDKVMIEILDASENLGFREYLLTPGTRFQELGKAVVQPLIDKARQQEELNDRLSDDQIISWGRAGLLLILFREDLDEQGQREYLRDFIFPAILKPGSDGQHKGGKRS